MLCSCSDPVGRNEGQTNPLVGTWIGADTTLLLYPDGTGAYRYGNIYPVTTWSESNGVVTIIYHKASSDLKLAYGTSYTLEGNMLRFRDPYGDWHSFYKAY